MFTVLIRISTDRVLYIISSKYSGSIEGILDKPFTLNL